MVSGNQKVEDMLNIYFDISTPRKMGLYSNNGQCNQVLASEQKYEQQS